MAFYDNVTNQRGQAAGSQGVDLRKGSNRKSMFAPVDATAAFLRSPEFQAYANPEDTLLPAATDSIFAGARTASRDAASNAQRLGLGRGAAAQMQTDIQRDASGKVAEATLGVQGLGQERRMAGSEMLLQQLQQAQQASAMRRMMHRQNSMTSLLQRNFATSFGANFGSQMGQSVGDLGGSPFDILTRIMGGIRPNG